MGKATQPANTMTAIDWKPDNAKLRQFGYIAIAGFGFIGYLLHANSLTTASYVVWALAILCPILSTVWPTGNRPIYLIMSAIGLVVGTIVGTILLGAFFLLVITPIALLFKLKKRDALRLAFDRHSETYWIDRPAPRPPADYYRQF